MNDSPYGLTASIWTNAKDNAESQKAFEFFADELETGTVFLNRCDYLDPALAWTGVKNSGRGISLSKFGEFVNLGLTSRSAGLVNWRDTDCRIRRFRSTHEGEERAYEDPDIIVVGVIIDKLVSNRICLYTYPSHISVANLRALWLLVLS